jgi:hypothetical protein
MKKFKEIFVCDKCAYESEDSNDFRQFTGNVSIPNNTDLRIGNNIFDIRKGSGIVIPDSIKEAIKNKQIDVINHNNELLITSTTLCLHCAIESLLQSMDENCVDTKSICDYEHEQVKHLTELIEGKIEYINTDIKK